MSGAAPAGASIAGANRRWLPSRPAARLRALPQRPLVAGTSPARWPTCSCRRETHRPSRRCRFRTGLLQAERTVFAGELAIVLEASTAYLKTAPARQFCYSGVFAAGRIGGDRPDGDAERHSGRQHAPFAGRTGSYSTKCWRRHRLAQRKDGILLGLNIAFRGDHRVRAPPLRRNRDMPSLHRTADRARRS